MEGGNLGWNPLEVCLLISALTTIDSYQAKSISYIMKAFLAMALIDSYQLAV